jgi:CubicO group peptidase (beta-lactamase class C family)
MCPQLYGDKLIAPVQQGVIMRTHRLIRPPLALLAGCLAVPVVGVPAMPAWSAPPARSAPASSAPPAGCVDPTTAAVSQLFDDAVAPRLAQDHVPGLVVSVVSAGRTVFAGGYGTADQEHDVAFDPARSLVRIASITKLFTWTAVMQQVQAGRLDLNADVNTYLSAFKVPATYPRPVTLQTLMDHTSGFEDRFIGAAAGSAADVPPLGDFLAANMPARIRPPGEVSAYSNYGAALAGYIVAQVSGEPFDQYVRRHILDPLGMTHSTATEPVPAAIAADLARSYDSETGQPIPFRFDRLAPDGSMSATATDMANFMIAQLHDGQFNGNAILSPASAEQMHQISFTADPRLGGYAHGFMERRMNGHQILMHDGGWEGFTSGLILVPGCDVGLFLSGNGTASGDTLAALVSLFFDRFVPTPASPDVPASTTGASATSVPRAGFYIPTRHNESTVEKLTTLLSAARMTVDAHGTVHFGGKQWLPQGGNLYGLADGSNHLVAFTGTDGRRYVATDGPAYQLVSQDRTLPFNLVVLLIFAVPALGALTLPLVALVRRLRHRPRATTRPWRAARWLAGGAAAVGFGFLVALFVVLTASGDAFLYGVPRYFTLLLVAPVLVLLASAAALGYTVIGWRSSGAGVVARIHQVTLLVGLTALAWFLWQWNLIGWQYS